MKSKTFAITVENEQFEFTNTEWETILTDNAYKLVKKLKRQGGRINLGIGSIKDYFKANFRN